MKLEETKIEKKVYVILSPMKATIESYLIELLLAIEARNLHKFRLVTDKIIKQRQIDVLNSYKFGPNNDSIP